MFGQATGCLATHVVASHHTLAPVPPGVSLAEAAALPTVFLTAMQCLWHAASVKPGQRVLVHAATGGLGLALTQLLVLQGARCCGTAGSPGKRAALRGSAHVMLDSRSTGGGMGYYSDEGMLISVANRWC